MITVINDKISGSAFVTTKWGIKLVTKKKPRNHFEDDFQVRCVRWFDAFYPHFVLFHIPNGGSRKVKVSKKGIKYSPEAVRFKAMGVRRGVLDLFLMEPRGGFFGLWIEMKSLEGKWSDEQKYFKEKAIKRNFKVEECRTYENFQKIIKEYLILEPTKHD